MKPLQALKKSNAPDRSTSDKPPDAGADKEGFTVIGGIEPIMVLSNKDNIGTAADESGNMGVAMGSYAHQPVDTNAEDNSSLKGADPLGGGK